jgi:hypothetical protein
MQAHDDDDRPCDIRQDIIVAGDRLADNAGRCAKGDKHQRKAEHESDGGQNHPAARCCGCGFALQFIDADTGQVTQIGRHNRQYTG